MSTSAVAVPKSGLFAVAGVPVPLEGVSVEAKIRDYGATVVLSQRFRNVEKQPIEAVYKFPLDEGAAVCGFEAEIDGRRVVGRVEEREKAFEAYDDALAAGHGAYLLDEERADVFTVSVGNIPAGKEVVLRITTVSELAHEGEDVRFTLPTTISPRYAPQKDQQGVGVSEAERVSPPYALSVPYGLRLNLDIEMSSPVRSLESPSHPIAMSIEGRSASVSLAAQQAAMDCDFVLKIGLAEPHRPAVLVERGRDGAGYAQLSFHPRFDAKQGPSEVVFVVDRSGSMQGSSIAEARNALQLCLRSLRTGCHFNVVGFGSSFEKLFDESRPYDDESLQAAAEHVSRLDADLGGTEILPALAALLPQAPVAGLPRQVFLLTDGEVSNTDEVIALVRQHAERSRVFTFGVGAGASAHLVKGIARAGRGEAEFIAPGERIEAKVLRQLGRALSPTLADVRVEWGGLAAQQAPHVPPPVFEGGRVLVFGRVENAAAATVTLRARAPEAELRFELPLDPSLAKDGSLVATLWARRRIRDLEEESSELHVARGSRQQRGKTVAGRAQEEVVRLGREYGLVSRSTSYVAVEERPDGTAGEILLRKVPSAVTRGWHGMAAQSYGVDLPRAMASPAFSRGGSRQPWSTSLFSRRSASFDDAEEVEVYDAMPRSMHRLPAPPEGPVLCEAAEPAERPLDALVALQMANGSWKLEPRLLRVLQLTRASVEARITRLRSVAKDVDPAQVERLLATALALRWLITRWADARDEWGLMADKARDWMNREAGPHARLFEEQATDLLG